ncbi:hypothetical protein [uncultured Duncaniella sp.]|uniref:hypothetical protein n=1 Tax=uncultured Duncaniella sp. TaxID=2768039 RepID=UPI0026743DFD|nr:hypothetical protein [uncultured Duncaniella sp.]
MRYTEKDIPGMPITAFLDALGEKSVGGYGYLKLYYAPYRDDAEALLVVDTKMNNWYDHGTDESGNLYDLAELTARGDHRKDISGYIVKMMNDNEIAKEMLTKRAIEPQVIHLDIAKMPLTDFMKALGQEHPVAADGDLRIYNTPYDSSAKGTMVINIRTNLWHDTKSGANGGIYDLAYELTGCANKSELNRYIAGEMNAYKQREHNKPEVKPKPLKAETNQPKRKMRR